MLMRSESTMKKNPFLLLLCPFLFLVTTPVFALEILKGEWQQGAVIIGQVPSGTSVSFDGRNLQLTPEGEFVFGLGRDAPAVAVITTIKGGVSEKHSFDVKPRVYDIQRVEGVPQKTIEPSKEQTERIKQESVLVINARKVDLPKSNSTSSNTKVFGGSN